MVYLPEPFVDLASHAPGHISSFLHCLYCRFDQDLLLLPEKAIELTKCAGGGNDINAVFYDSVHRRAEGLCVDRHGRVNSVAIVCSERWHHSTDAR